MMDWHTGAWSAGDWVAMSLMMAAFWGIIAALVVWVVHSLSNKPSPTSSSQRQPASPDDVLADRFARGDINEDEFTSRRAVLHGTGRPAGGT